MNSLRPILVWAAILAFSSTALYAEPELLADFQKTNGATRVAYLRESGGVAFFGAHDGVREDLRLWKTDGTAGGTVMVTEDRILGWAESHAILINGVYYFCGEFPSEQGLWRSDGTAEGTYVLKNDINWDIVRGEVPFASLNGLLVFSGQTSEYGNEIWLSDGTPEGTALLKDIAPGPSGHMQFSDSGISSGGLFHFAADDGVSGMEPWRTDGTPEGTYQLVDGLPGPDGMGPLSYRATQSLVYFLAASDLWRTDGTPGGTYPLRGGLTYGWPGDPTVVGDWIFFVADGDLWRTSGVQGAAVRIHDYIAPDNRVNEILGTYGGSTYLAVYDTTRGEELWKTDGTSGGTGFLAELSPGPAGSYPRQGIGHNGRFFFTAGPNNSNRELYVTDGTSLGTALLRDIYPGAKSGLASLGNAIPMGGDILFFGNDGVHDWEPWVSDGTSTGTHLLRDINRVGEGEISDMIAAGGGVFFKAHAQTTADDSFGTELGFSGGTPGTTSILRDIKAGSQSSDAQYLHWAGGYLYFSADDGVAGRELWRSDGTSGGTTRLADIAAGPNSSNPKHMTSLGDRVFFSADDGSLGTELYAFDPANGNAAVVKDINVAGDGLLESEGFGVMGGELYFTGNDGAQGGELWKSDGTEPGTILLRDINAGAGHSGPRNFVTIGDSIFFEAYEPTHGSELWISDGTPDGTRLVKDVATGPASSNLAWMTPCNGALYFAATTTSTGTEVWISDGTTAGTHIVKDISPAFGVSSSPEHFAAAGNYLYFVANHRRIMRTDGTGEGTVEVLDPIPGEISNPRELTFIGRDLFLSLSDAQGGRELGMWTNAVVPSPRRGSFQIYDMYPGEIGSDPRHLTAAGNTLYFVADTPEEWTSLWRLDVTPTPLGTMGWLMH